MTNIQRWRQKNFIGGSSYADLLGLQDSFLYARAVDVRSLPGSAILQKRMEPYLEAISKQVNGYVRGIFLQDDGDFYIGTTPNTTSLPTTDALLNGILDPVTGDGEKDYIIAGKKYLHRLRTIDLAAGTVGSADNQWKDLTNGGAIAESRRRPIIQLNNKIFVGIPGGVTSIDNTGIATHKDLDLGDKTLHPIKFTFTGKWLKIWCVNDPGTVNGSDKTYVYFWDMVADSYEYRAVLDDGAAFAIETIDGNDIAAVESPTGTKLFYSQGFGFQPAGSFPSKTDIKDTDPLTQLGATYNGLFLFGFGAENNTTGNIYDRAGVWSYGTLHPNIAPAFTFDYPITKTEVNIRIIAIGVDRVKNESGIYDPVVYVSWTNGTIHGVDVLSATKYAGEGMIIGRMFDGNDMGLEKDAKRAMLAYARPRKGVSLQLFVRHDELNIDEIYKDSFSGDPLVSVTDKDNSVKKVTDRPNIEDHVFLQTKVVLKTENPLETPRLIGIDIDYESDETTEEA